MAADDASHDRVVVVVDYAEVVAELVSERLFAFGASAVATDEVSVGHEAAIGSADPSGVADVEPTGARQSGVRLTADILESSLSELSELSFPGDNLAWRVVDPGTSWLDAWKEHARIWRTGAFLVRPPWIDLDVGDGGATGKASSTGPVSGRGTGAPSGDDSAVIELVVDPSYSFGSGSHPTTRACLELLGGIAWERRAVEQPGGATAAGAGGSPLGGRVLDVGVGSGILAVAALKVGFDYALGIDIDPNALSQAPLVAEANGVGGRFEVSSVSVGRLASAPDTQRFDLVLANLLIPLIEEFGADLLGLCAPGGSLIVSGVMADQRGRTLDALASSAPGDFSVAAELVVEGWLGIRLVRESG